MNLEFPKFWAFDWQWIKIWFSKNVSRVINFGMQIIICLKISSSLFLQILKILPNKNNLFTIMYTSEYLLKCVSTPVFIPRFRFQRRIKSLQYKNKIFLEFPFELWRVFPWHYILIQILFKNSFYALEKFIFRVKINSALFCLFLWVTSEIKLLCFW